MSTDGDLAIGDLILKWSKAGQLWVDISEGLGNWSDRPNI